MSPWMSHRLFEDPKALLAETRALQGLARSLVGDVHAADDLVQGTWLTAMGRGLPGDGQGSWLRGILRNLLRQERRASRRREKRERLAARPEAEPEGSLERLEVLQAVVEATRGLPEPYRSTVVARFFEGRRAEEIARSQGVPAATVRTHLHRALGMLREILDRRFSEERKDWRSLLLFTPNTLVPTAVMSTKLKIVVVLVFVAGLFWSMTALLSGMPGGNAGAPPSVDGLSVAAGEGERSEVVEVEEPAVEGRTELAAGTAEEGGQAAELSITGIVLGESGEALAGARVWSGRREAITDEGGRYELPQARSTGPGFLNAGAAGYATDRRIFEQTEDALRVDFELRREFRIRGRVTDGDGQGVEGAEVDTFFNRGESVHTDGEGRYLLAGLDPGRTQHLLDARKQGFVRSQVTVQTEGDEIVRDLVLERGNEVRGTVVDAGGEPVAGAGVYIGFDPNAWDRLDEETDARGGFTFPAVQTGDRRLVVQDGEHAPVTLQVAVPERPETMEPLRIELSEGRNVAGRVVDEGAVLSKG